MFRPWYRVGRSDRSFIFYCAGPGGYYYDGAAGHGQREVQRRHKICREEGGYGYTQYHDPNGDWLGWFSGPNHGEPFNGELRARVTERVLREMK